MPNRPGSGETGPEGSPSAEGRPFLLLGGCFGADRLAEFQRAREGGLSEREIGMFEGQLRLDAERGHRMRLWQVWAGLAQIVGGGIILVSTAASDTTQGDEEVGYILGGVVAGVGAISLAKALLSHAERVWQAYLEEEVVPEANAVDIVPAAGPGAARIDVVGRF